MPKWSIYTLPLLALAWHGFSNMSVCLYYNSILVCNSSAKMVVNFPLQLVVDLRVCCGARWKKDVCRTGRVHTRRTVNQYRDTHRTVLRSRHRVVTATQRCNVCHTARTAASWPILNTSGLIIYNFLKIN